MRLAPALFLLLATVPAAGLTGSASAADRPAAELWRPAPGYQVTTTGVQGPAAEVFHSSEFSKLLVLPDTGQAFLLDLSARTVAAVRRSDLTITKEGATLAADAPPRPLGDFAQDGANLAFTAGGARWIVSPAPTLTGETPLATLLARKPEYAAGAKAYKPDPSAIEKIRAIDQPTEIVVFLGTWCEICLERMPAFIKTIEVAANPQLTVRYVCVDPNFGGPRKLLDQYKVHRTPTFVVMRGDTEVGRLDKEPPKRVENSIADILSGSR